MTAFVIDSSALLELFIGESPDPQLRRRVLTQPAGAPELVDSITSYDAAYIALAEQLDVPLVTCDGRLAKAHGHNAKIELYPMSAELARLLIVTKNHTT